MIVKTIVDSIWLITMFIVVGYGRFTGVINTGDFLISLILLVMSANIFRLNEKE